MKKIFSLAAAGFILAGSLAAQPSINASVRIKSNLLSTDFDEWKFLDYHGYGAIGSSLLFSASTKSAGIEIGINPVISFDESSSPDKWDKILSLGTYDAWVKFGKNQEFTLKAGSWDGRAVGCVNAGRLAMDGIDFSPCNPGMISSITSKKLGMDISSQCGSAETNKLAAMFQYDNGSLEIRGSAANLDFTSADGFSMNDKIAFGVDTFMAEVGYKIPYVGRVLVNGKFAKDELAAGAFFEPAFPFLKNLTALIGFTGEFEGEANVQNAGTNLWGFGADIRARYVFDKNISVTTINNFTLNQLDVATSTPVNVGLAMENMVNMLYNVHPRRNDLLVYVNIRHFTGLPTSTNYDYKPTLLTAAESGNSSKLDWVSNFRISNVIEYNFNENAKIDAGIAFNILNCFNNQASNTDPVFTIQVPLAFQVSF